MDSLCLCRHVVRRRVEVREEQIPLTGTFSDQALGPAIGVGLEWGPPRYAFFVDFGVTFVDIELIPGDKESFTVGNSITGFTYRS